MLIIPAIDIIEGKCVRLTKGKFDSKKIYNENPLCVARKFEEQGAAMIHVIDLDGAKTGKPVNLKLISQICEAVRLPVQVGGGIRDFATAEKYFCSGVYRIIIGTKAVCGRDFIKKLLAEFGSDRIVISIDCNGSKVATRGWQSKGSENIFEFAKNLKILGIKNVIVTDISRDGTLTEPNFVLTAKIQKIGLNVIAAGGVSSLESIKKLKKLKICGAIIGKAIYEGKINLGYAIKLGEPLSGLTKRIIPCLDVKNGRVVKGINFKNLVDAGDPVELGKKYAECGADELVFLDITASKEKRKILVEIVRVIAREIFIPFTVGGGIKTIEDVRNLLMAGADKITINTAAVLNPNLISQAAKIFGSQCVVVSIDVLKSGNGYFVYIKGGSQKTDLEAVSWAQEVERLGAGEIMLTSMDRDGTKDGFDTEILKKISGAVKIPVIASGGAGNLQDFANALNKGKSDAVLAASLFHFNKFSIAEVKNFLLKNNIPTRL